MLTLSLSRLHRISSASAYLSLPRPAMRPRPSLAFSSSSAKPSSDSDQLIVTMRMVECACPRHTGEGLMRGAGVGVCLPRSLPSSLAPSALTALLPGRGTDRQPSGLIQPSSLPPSLPPAVAALFVAVGLELPRPRRLPGALPVGRSHSQSGKLRQSRLAESHFSCAPSLPPSANLVSAG